MYTLSWGFIERDDGVLSWSGLSGLLSFGRVVPVSAVAEHGEGDVKENYASDGDPLCEIPGHWERLHLGRQHWLESVMHRQRAG